MHVQKESYAKIKTRSSALVSEEHHIPTSFSCAMAPAVSRRPLTAEARVRSRISPCGICGGQSGTGTGVSTSTSVFPCQFHSTRAPLKRKSREILSIFITGLLAQ
jgi:hypothetical protein